MSLSPFERGSAQPRQAQPRTFPSVYEAISVRPLSVAPCAYTHLPRRQARAFRGESSSMIFEVCSFTINLYRIAPNTSTLVSTPQTPQHEAGARHAPCVQLQTYNLLSGQVWTWRSFSSTTRNMKMLLKVSESDLTFNL